MMDDLSEGDSHKEDEPASPAPPPSQQHTDPASPTVAVTPEPVATGEQATPSEIEYQVKVLTRMTFFKRSDPPMHDDKCNGSPKIIFNDLLIKAKVKQNAHA